VKDEVGALAVEDDMEEEQLEVEAVVEAGEEVDYE